MPQKRLLAAAFIFPFFYTHFISHSHSTLWLGFVVLFLCLFLFRAMCLLIRTREECVMVTKLVVEMIKKLSSGRHWHVVFTRPANRFFFFSALSLFRVTVSVVLIIIVDFVYCCLFAVDQTKLRFRNASWSVFSIGVCQFQFDCH